MASSTPVFSYMVLVPAFICSAMYQLLYLAVLCMFAKIMVYGLEMELVVSCMEKEYPALNKVLLNFLMNDAMI